MSETQTASGNPSFLSVRVRNANGDEVDVASGLANPKTDVGTEKNPDALLGDVVDASLNSIQMNDNGGIADVVVTTDNESNPVFTTSNETANILVTLPSSQTPEKKGLVGYILGFAAILNSKVNSLIKKTVGLSDDGATYSGKLKSMTEAGTGILASQDEGIVWSNGNVIFAANSNTVVMKAGDASLLATETGNIQISGGAGSNVIVNSSGINLTCPAISLGATKTLQLTATAAVPGSSTAAGTVGEVRFDDANGIMYRCIKGGAAGSAKWVRFPIDSTWT